MTKDEMANLLRTDVKAWNRWRSDLLDLSPSGASNENIDLSGVNLSGAKLPRAMLNGVNLVGANLDRAHLSMADLTHASLAHASLVGAVLINAELAYCTLHGANLERANFGSANLKYAFLGGASLKEADLRYAILERTVLTGANLTGATISGTLFADMDLRGVKGLESAHHILPSTIGVDTIYRSEGEISQSFLRDTGVPEGLIIQISSLIGAQDGIQFYSCFISYSHKDEAFAERLFSKMRDAKLRVWYAPEEMKGGQKLHEQIETAIRVYDKLLVVLSDASLSSEWVKTEIRNARRAEKVTGKRKLFPVRLVDMETIQAWSCFDADTGKDLGVELREYFIPDFREWKNHDKFESSFKRLLRDLKSDSASQTT